MQKYNEVLRDFLYNGNSSDSKILVHLADNTFLLNPHNYNDDNFYSKIDKVIEESEDDKINCEIIGEDNFIDYSKSYSLYISDIIC